MKKTGNYKHGGRYTRLYNIWRAMRQRCKNPNGPRSHCYIDRGIKVCEEWESFVTFREWALQNGYRDDLSLDRINNDGNYEPNNCRWADSITQQNNRRTNRLVTYQGETHTIREWERIKGMKSGLLWSRLYDHKWDIERALR